MRILIWGGDSWTNQGDAAILAGTIESLLRRAPEAEVVVASGHPEVTRRAHGLPAVRRWTPAFFRSLARADLVLWGGGQMVQNESSRPFLLAQLLFVAVAVALRRTVVCYSQGAGEVRGTGSRWLARQVLRRLDLITVRDGPSAGRLRSLGLPAASVVVTADPALALTPSGEEEARAALARAGVGCPFVAIALRRWGHYSGGWRPVRFQRGATQPWFHRLCDDLAAAADHCAGPLGLQPLFVPMCPGGDQGDERVAHEVLSRMAHRDRARVLEEVPAPAVLKAILGRAELVIGMRTHAVILGAAAGSPVVSLSYQGKGEAFMDALGLGEYALRVEDVDREGLLRLLDRGWSEREAIRRTIAQNMPDLVRRAEEAAELALGAATDRNASAPAVRAAG